MTNSRLDKLKQQREAFLARAKEAEASIKNMEARNSEKERKEDLRRRILVGACMMDKYKKEGKLELLTQEMDKFLHKDIDRILFGLLKGDKSEMINTVLETGTKDVVY